LKEHANLQDLSLQKQSSIVEEAFGPKKKGTDRANEIPITRICVTGGPCAGKTTALADLDTVLKQMGFRVLVVPEAATILKKGGSTMQTD